MAMIPAFCFLSFQEYIDKRGLAELDKPKKCLNQLCLKQDGFWKHGSYERKAFEEENEQIIKVQRFICKYCRKTVSCLYVFLVPYRRFTAREIAGRIQKYLQTRNSYRDLAGILEPADSNNELLMPGHTTVWRWIGQFVHLAANNLFLQIQRLLVMAANQVSNLEESGQIQCPNGEKAKSTEKQEHLNIGTRLLKYGETLFGDQEHLVSRFYTRFLINAEKFLAILSGRHVVLLATHYTEHLIF